MKRRRLLFVAGALLSSLLVMIAIAWATSSGRTPSAPRRPELGGQPVPASVYDIKFDRRYDIHCSFSRIEPTVYRGCLILGITGRGEEQAERRPRSSSSSLSSYGAVEPFEHWLVLGLADGRKAYIPPRSVEYIEEAGTSVAEGHAVEQGPDARKADDAKR